MKHSLWIAVGLMLMESALTAATLNYSQNFNWEQTNIPTSASAVADYWYFVGDPADYYSGATMTGGVEWFGGGPGVNNRWLGASQGSGDGLGHFHGQAYRNFRTAGPLAALAADQSVVGATVSAYTNGGGSVDDQYLFSGLWLVDDSGNGYAGHVTHNGDMSLYKSVGWLLTPIGTGASGVSGGNAKEYSLSVAGGNVTLNFNYYGNATVYSKSVADASYSAFTTIGLEGAYFTNEGLGFDNVGFTGTVIPEPATAGLLAVAGALVLMRRRKQG